MRADVIGSERLARIFGYMPAASIFQCYSCLAPAEHECPRRVYSLRNMLYGTAPKSTTVAVTVAMPTLASLVTGMRIYARLAISKNAGRDDAFIVAAVVSK
jgi:hypothetical protein